jgi:hypothetical protein
MNCKFLVAVFGRQKNATLHFRYSVVNRGSIYK